MSATNTIKIWRQIHYFASLELTSILELKKSFLILTGYYFIYEIILALMRAPPNSFAAMIHAARNETRNEKRETRNEKRETRNEKRETRDQIDWSEGVK
jgi:hypothetical protein